MSRVGVGAVAAVHAGGQSVERVISVQAFPFVRARTCSVAKPQARDLSVKWGYDESIRSDAFYKGEYVCSSSHRVAALRVHSGP